MMSFPRVYLPSAHAGPQSWNLFAHQPYFLHRLLTFMALPSAAQSNPVSALPSPTTVPGDTNYELLGCYNELPPSTSGIAFGATGTYVSPTLPSDNAFTIPLCLEGCGLATAPNVSGRYIYAAIGASR